MPPIPKPTTPHILRPPQYPDCVAVEMYDGDIWVRQEIPIALLEDLVAMKDRAGGIILSNMWDYRKKLLEMRDEQKKVASLSSKRNEGKGATRRTPRNRN